MSFRNAMANPRWSKLNQSICECRGGTINNYASCRELCVDHRCGCGVGGWLQLHFDPLPGNVPMPWVWP